ncbi:MAG: hypothetical protein AAGI89_03965 [Pseudomonadota bacterium]
MYKLLSSLAAVGVVFAGTASAAIQVFVTQSSSFEVTAEFDGSLDLTDANLLRSGVRLGGGVNARFNALNFARPANTSSDSVDLYEVLTFPSFGPGQDLTGSNNVSGDTFAINTTFISGSAIGSIGVAAGYQSGDQTSGSQTFVGTIASLGFAEGIYEYQLPNDTVTLFVGDVAPPDPVPLPGAAVLFAPALLGGLALRRKRSAA